MTIIVQNRGNKLKERRLVDYTNIDEEESLRIADLKNKVNAMKSEVERINSTLRDRFETVAKLLMHKFRAFKTLFKTYEKKEIERKLGKSLDDLGVRHFKELIDEVDKDKDKKAQLAQEKTIELENEKRMNEIKEQNSQKMNEVEKEFSSKLELEE